VKRKALLIGNTHGLEGVKVDLRSFETFLTSDRGGVWRSGEIDVKPDIRKAALDSLIQDYRSEKYDYLMIVFSGHGGQKRETILELNKFQETISEPSLRGIATRQLNIYDCCRAFPAAVQDSLTMESREFSKSLSDAESIRARYDRRIMQAVPQQALLYSCAIGQYSYDSAKGGVYLQNLLKSTGTVEGEFKLVGVAHQEAKARTEAQVLQEHAKAQNPEAVLLKVLSEQQLVFSMKPTVTRL